MRSILVAGGLAWGWGGGLGPAAHANLVLNGGFEAPVASPPAPPVPDWAVSSGVAGIDTSNPNNGSQDAFLTNDGNGNAAVLSQTINGLVDGQQYTVVFFVAADGPVL